MKKILFTLALLMLGMSASAQEFTVDGIRYEVVGSNTVKTGLNYDTGINDFDIPETVEYDGRTYAVSCIGPHLTSIESTSVKIPQTIQVIESRAFARTESLKKVYITNIAAWVGIEFQGEDSNPLSKKNYTNLTVYINGEATRDIELPETVGAIKKNAFYCCYWLSSIKLPETLTVIQENAFYNCWGLQTITLPKNVNTIKDYAFYGCNGLNSVIVEFSHPVELEGKHLFDTETYTRATLYVPAGAKQAFEASETWGQFANIVEVGSSGISQINTTKPNSKAYGLNGVELLTPDTAKGIVIQNGKKTVRK